MHPNVTIAAKRLGAQLRAERETAIEAQQNTARECLARTIAQHGLAVHQHFESALGPERSLWVDCRLESRNTDQQLVYAILDEQGWRPDRDRLSRVNHRYDITRLKHASTNATLVVIIKLPMGEVGQWEAA